MVYLLPKSHTLGTQVTCMDALFDPESLRRQSGTTFRDEQSVDSTDDFEYFRSIAGLVAIGIPTEGGQILLMDSPHGWRLPYGPVEPGADWAAVARQFGTEMTGKDIAIDTAERIARIERRLENGNEETTSYEAVLRAAPVEGQPVNPTSAFGPWNDVEIAWFSSVPDDAYWDHGDAIADVRRCLERGPE